MQIEALWAFNEWKKQYRLPTTIEPLFNQVVIPLLNRPGELATIFKLDKWEFGVLGKGKHGYVSQPIIDFIKVMRVVNGVVSPLQFQAQVVKETTCFGTKSRKIIGGWDYGNQEIEPWECASFHDVHSFQQLDLEPRAKPVDTSHEDHLGDLQTALSYVRGLKLELSDFLKRPSYFYTRKYVCSSNSRVAFGRIVGPVKCGQYRVRISQLAAPQSVAVPYKPPNYEFPEEATFEIQGGVVHLSKGDRLLQIQVKLDPFVSTTLVGGRLELTSKSTGNAGKIIVKDLKGTALTELGLVDESGEFAEELSPPKDCELALDGLPVFCSSNELDDLIHGIRLTCCQVGRTQIDVVSNLEEVAEEIQELCDTFDWTISQLEDLKLDHMADRLKRAWQGTVMMGGIDWEGELTLSSEAKRGAMQLEVSGFTAPEGVLKQGDKILVGQKHYTLSEDALIQEGKALISLSHPLQQAINAGASIGVLEISINKLFDVRCPLEELESFLTRKGKGNRAGAIRQLLLEVSGLKNELDAVIENFKKQK